MFSCRKDSTWTEAARARAHYWRTRETKDLGEEHIVEWIELPAQLTHQTLDQQSTRSVQEMLQAVQRRNTHDVPCVIFSKDCVKVVLL